MTSIIRIGQSKFVTHPIDEDSQERILNCIQTLSELGNQAPAREVFLHETKAAYSKMVTAQEVGLNDNEAPITTHDALWNRKKLLRNAKQKPQRRQLSRLMISFRSGSSPRKARMTLST